MNNEQCQTIEAIETSGFYITGTPFIVHTSKDSVPMVIRISRCGVPTIRVPARLQVLPSVSGEGIVCYELLLPKTGVPEGILVPAGYLLTAVPEHPIKFEGATFLVQEG